jgi:hypothetical protein
MHPPAINARTGRATVMLCSTGYRQMNQGYYNAKKEGDEAQTSMSEE